MNAAPVLIQFHVRVTLPRDHRCAVIVVGEIPEIFTFNFTDRDPNWRERRLHHLLLGSIQSYQENLQKETSRQDGHEYEDETAEGIADYGVVRKDHTIQLRYFEEMDVLLHPDPDGLDVDGLYALRKPLRIRSKKPGQRFRFAYLIWDLDETCIFSMERLTMPREFIVPEHPVGLYKIFSGKFDDRAGEFVEVCKANDYELSEDEDGHNSNGRAPIGHNPYADLEDGELRTSTIEQSTRRVMLPPMANPYERPRLVFSGCDSDDSDDEF